MSTAEEIIQKLRAAISSNAGKPPSLQAFFRVTGLNQRHLHRAGWPTYGALLRSQGYEAASMRSGYTDEQVFRPLAELMVKLGHFSTQSEREVERHRDSNFPSSEAYRKRGRGTHLELALRRWCEATGNFPQLLQELKEPDATPPVAGPTVRGYIYMMRAGRRVKIGRESFEGARQAAAGTWLENPEIIHRIATDDPEGVERYWHHRFERQGKRVRNELFNLSPADIAAFKAWKRIV